MKNYPGLLTFMPVEDPGLPEPYATGSAAEKEIYEVTEKGRAQYWENFQKINNHTVIAEGNKAAENAVSEYNTRIENFHLNGGEAGGYSFPVESELHLEQYYQPAEVASTDPPTETKAWTLPEGTVLYVVAVPYYPAAPATPTGIPPASAPTA